MTALALLDSTEMDCNALALYLFVKQVFKSSVLGTVLGMGY